MKVALLTLLLSVSGVTVPVAAQAMAQSYHLNIARQPLDKALKELAQQTGLQVARFSDSPTGSALVGPLVGDISIDQALRSLLASSGLAYKIVNDHTIAVVPTGPGSSSAAPLPAGSPRTTPDDEAQPKGGKNGSSAGFRLAEVAQGAPASAAAVDEGNEGGGNANRARLPLEEIVVTAEKREERLQDVPVSVTAIGAETLAQNNQLLLRDFYSMVPGLIVIPGAQGNQTLSIRGISMGLGTNPTVGVTVDDVPYGSSTNSGGGNMIPDIDPSDLARVEVLRGPQGTLYGASSMGGLLKFVTADPSTDRLTGRVQAGTTGVANGVGLGYDARGSVNVPISNSLAVRATAFTRRDPGYIDNVATHVNGVNEVDAFGGRVAALWQPSELYSFKVSALSQEIKGYGVSDVAAGLGDLQQSYIPGTGRYTRKVQAYSATVHAKLGVVDLTSVSGYNVNENVDNWDYTFGFGAVNNFLFHVSGAPATDDARTGKFTEELRLSVPFGSSIDWLLGGFYTHETSSWAFDLLAADATTGQVVGTPFADTISTGYREYAGFTDLTFHFTDRFDVQLGGRESHIEQTYSDTTSGALFGGVTTTTPEADTSANAFTYLLTPRFKWTPDLMVYARLASGYRTGGHNTDPDRAVPRQYDPDKTQNYELGVKGAFLDRTLFIDASLYYIDWKHIQIVVADQNPGYFSFSYVANSGTADSRGLELAVESRPLEGLKIAGSIDVGKAALKDALPAGSQVHGVAGDRLPGSTRFSGNLSVEQQFPLVHGMTGLVGATVSYIGERLGYFQKTSARSYYPAYAKTDFRAGLRYQSWDINFFVNNAFERRGIVGGGLGDFPPNAFQIITPRVVGLNVAMSF